ncbi:MAG: dTDP-4-dehydrorhamnose 3,5-epimerase family protein [Pirellulales bacterium]|nr:dTDP-4-dehydrorhamnose 3,5-epimerase family protein [Pirellulales bacterium]
MFEQGIIDGVVIRPLRQFQDQRGWLIELYREDELPPADRPAMAYISQTLSGVARGPHEHREQTDVFAFVGPGDFKLYLWDTRPDSPTRGVKQTLVAGQSNHQAVVVPPGIIHAYKNISDVAGLVFNCPNRLYAGEGRREPVDETRHEDLAESPYVLD